MTAKKKKQPKNDYLILAAFASLTAILAGNLYVWWDPAEPLTSISSSISFLWWTLLIPAIIFIGCLIFWFLMTIDALQKKKFIWFLFILIGPIIIGLLYFLVEKPNILKRNARTLAWLAIVLIFFFWMVVTVSEIKERANSSVDNDLTIVSFKGSLVSKDSDGPGVYKVKTKEGIVRVDVGPNPPCDPAASEVPPLEPRNKIIIQAVQNGDKSYSVCEANTFIRNL